MGARRGGQISSDVLMPLSFGAQWAGGKGQSRRKQGERRAGGLEKLEESLQMTPDWEDWEDAQGF